MIRTKNLLSCKSAVEQELAALEKILADYEEKNYSNMCVLIMNYLGHIQHYCSHEGLVQRLLSNFCFSLEKEAKGILTDKNDSFKKFVQGRIDEIKWDVEHGYLSKDLE